MRRLPAKLGALALSLAIGLSLLQVNGLHDSMTGGVAEAAGTCGLSSPAFCDTFSQPAGTGNRSGQLNGAVWGVSRTTGNNNSGQNQIDAWSPTQLETCSGTQTVQPENDIVVCNGQLREATNDHGTVTALTMYPKQPFDFAGRTGTVTFDVSNDTQGSHAAWPEFWLTDKPVPAPFTHFDSWMSVPQHGFGLRFYSPEPPNKGSLLAPACPNDGNTRWTVGSAVAVRNYVVDDQDNGGAFKVTPLDCVIASTGPNGGLNHVQLNISQSQIDVYATDAGTTAPLRHIGVVQNANLTLTRGLIWIEDVHYNAEKVGSQGTHTFAWANVGFDGPVLPRDLTFDALDSLHVNGDGTINLGWQSQPNSPPTLSIPNVNNIQNASAALLAFNFNVPGASPPSFTYVVNGHTHTFNWPYPDTTAFSWRSLAMPVPLSDLVTGNNTVSISAGQPIGIANVDIILVGAGGGGSIGSGSGSESEGAGSSPTSTPIPPTNTPVAPTNTPVQPTATSTRVPASATPTNTSVPATPTSTRVPLTATPTSTSVNPAPTPIFGNFNLSAQIGTPIVSPAGSQAFTVNVKSLAGSKVLVDLEVFSIGGVKAYQQYWDNQSFAAGQTRSYTANWAVPAGLAKGTYSVRIGIFSTGWGTLYAWNDTAGTMIVR